MGCGLFYIFLLNLYVVLLYRECVCTPAAVAWFTIYISCSECKRGCNPWRYTAVYSWIASDRPSKDLLTVWEGHHLRAGHGQLRWLMVECFWLVPPPWQRLVDYLGRPPSKGWIAQMKEHWYSSDVGGSSLGSVKVVFFIT